MQSPPPLLPWHLLLLPLIPPMSAPLAAQSTDSTNQQKPIFGYLVFTTLESNSFPEVAQGGGEGEEKQDLLAAMSC